MYLLSEMYSTVEDKCWCCGQEHATVFHMWWGYNDILNFWQMIQENVREIFGLYPPLSPRLFLRLDFHHFHIRKHEICSANLLTTASVIIAKIGKFQLLLPERSG